MENLPLSLEKAMVLLKQGRFDKAEKLAWFVGSTLFNESLLCRTCWQGQFNRLTERERKEWAFYDNKKPRTDK